MRIHLAKRKRDPKKFDVDRLAEQAENFSGAEIEQGIIAAMYDAFDQDREVATDDVLHAMESSVPLSVTMREDLERLRLWARDRARPASA